MGNTYYSFKISAYDVNNLLPQVSKALEKRTELVSRERYPGLWKHTDALNAITKGRTRSRLRTRIMSIVCLLLGVFLFVPGLVKPQELLVPLFVGAIAIGAGIGGLRRSRKNKKNPYDKSAKLLLSDKDNISVEQSIEVSFSEDAMTIPTEDSNVEIIPYSNFECAIETVDGLLFVYDARVTLLQKKDLGMGNVDDFCKFISKKVAKYEVIS